MRVDEVMVSDVAVVSPDETVRDAALLMGDLDAVALPVGRPGGPVIGIVTERDILLRLVARGLAPGTTPVAAVMSSEVTCCHAGDSADEVAAIMNRRQIRRMPVLDRRGRLIGLVSLADILAGAAAR
jgi:CBS domain-containing protein